MTRAGRPDVSLFFDDEARLSRMELRITDPASGNEVQEVVKLSGVTEAAGLRWPRRLELTWRGNPDFDLESLEFLPLETLPDWCSSRGRRIRHPTPTGWAASSGAPSAGRP